VRGGARSGAGRKSSLTTLQALLVGEHCESAWLRAAEDQAFERYERDPVTKMIRDEQARTDLIPRFARRRGAQRDISESIDDITDGKRGVSIPLKRPYGAKAGVLEGAIAWCQQEYGQIITTSKATECWKEYKRFQKWASNAASLNST
jgi:hypothetical protein